MARYIDADKLLKELQRKQKPHESTYTTGRMFFAFDIAIINEQPTADVVEVVRCKDCKYWSVEYRFCVMFGLDAYGGSPFYEKSFCSCGRRKEAQE